jgi:hypothetical protein
MSEEADVYTWKIPMPMAVTARPWLPCLVVAGLSACSFDPPPPAIEPPKTAAIFCNIEAGRDCATAEEEAMGVDIAHQFENGFWINKSSKFGLDYSPAALAACQGRPQKIIYQGAFPEGSPVCVNPRKALGVEPGFGNLPGAFVGGTFSTVTQACQSWCDEHDDWIDGDGNKFRCDHIAWRSEGTHGPTLGACTEAGTFVEDFQDLRKFEPLPIVWRDLINVAVVNGSILRKTSVSAGGAGAASTSVLASGDGFAAFTAVETNTERIFGLAIGTPPDVDPSSADIKWGFFIRKNGTVAVIESGVVRFTLPAYPVNGRFRIAIVGGIVQYFVDGELFYTSDTPVTPASYPLRVSVALRDLGATIVSGAASF